MKEDTHFIIIGLGLLGGSYAKGLSEAGYSVDAIDINEENLAVAKANGWIKNGSTKPDPQMIAQADLAVFGVYPDTIVPWLRENQPLFKSGCLITDVTGVKTGIVEEIQAFLRPDLEFVGAHPMAGREVSGAKYSDNGIFKVANFIITPTEKNTPEAILKIRQLAELLGFAHIVELSIAEHDKMISFVSQLTHVIAVTLMNTSDNTHLAEYTGDSFRDLTRIAKINENLWTELFLLNKENLLADIDAFQQALAHFRSALQAEDEAEIKRLFRQSTARRRLFD